ncbi:flagellar hook capping FlgD N-terminal domain-containing protein [Paracoccus onubensis]|uniref:Basal-body rod modification protein FlgD n=1 Tax=Paracoccus onubensis TaxID=1675788 RepID=A0A418SM09_9RHOB|nr:flagellar hook capping FlgD N-terminal domain-containing protein [Paracoccus onubensis]RJE81932.1 flagellar basal body rod modification protein [Paracoccus onubensis]
MITATGQTTASTATATATDEPVIGAGADFDTFLALLTTQLQNQDPLNPLEGHEFAAQLATFSGVEQQAYTNKLLGQMMKALGANELGQAAGWIGKEARTTAPIWFGNEPLTLEIEPAPLADDVDLITYNSAGLEIARERIGSGSGQIDWFGRDTQGEKLPDDHYYFRIESILNGNVIAQSEVGAYARIEGVRKAETGTELILANGTTIAASQIDALRNAE